MGIVLQAYETPDLEKWYLQGKGSQTGAVGDVYISARKFDISFRGEIFEHPGDNFSGAADEACNLLVSHVDRVGLFVGGFLQKKEGKPFIKTHKKHLLHCPHDVGETFGCQLVGEGFYINIFLHDL